MNSIGLRPPLLPVFALSIALVVIMSSSGCRKETPEERYAAFMKSGQSFLAKKDYVRALIQFRNAGEVKKSAEAYYQAALAFVGLHDMRSAAAQLIAATKLDPTNTPAQLALSEVMLDTSDKELYEGARKRLESVVAGKAGGTEALLALGIAELDLGKPQDAVGHLQEALAKAPESLQTAIILASVKLAIQDAQGAEAVLAELARREPKSADVALVLGRFYWAQGSKAEAKNQYHRALDIDPNSGPALWELARTEMADGKADVADRLYKRLSALPDKQYRPFHAIFLMQQNSVDAAVQELEKLAESDPKNPYVRRVLTRVYLDTGQPQRALNGLSAALKKQPKDSDALFQRGHVYLRLGKPDEAEKDLQQVLHFNGNSAKAHFELAMVFEARGNTASEAQELDKALTLSPQFLDARIQMARLMIAKNDPAAALDLMDKASDSQKNAIPAIVERNWALLALKRPDARKEVDLALSRVKAPELLVQDALLKFQQKDYATGRVSLRAALQANPTYLEAVSHQYDSYMAENDRDQAISTLQEYAARQPNSAPLEYLLALKLKANGKMAEARTAVLAAKKADPRYKLADVLLAQLDLYDNKLAAARQRLTGVLKSDPNDVGALFLLGNVDDLSGRRDAAIADYRKVVQIDRTNVLALNNLAFLLSNPKTSAEALQYAQQAVELVPDNPEVLDTLGWAYYQAGMYNEALKEFKIASAKGGSPRWKYHLAMACVKTGNLGRASKIVISLAGNNPDLPEAKMAERLLEDSEVGH